MVEMMKNKKWLAMMSLIVMSVLILPGCSEAMEAVGHELTAYADENGVDDNQNVDVDNLNDINVIDNVVNISDNVKVENDLDEADAISYRKVGETIHIRNAAIIIQSVETSLGTEKDRPREGYEYVTVQLTIENIGSRELTYSPYDFRMKNSTGQIMDKDLNGLDMDTALRDGLLKSGGKVQGTIVFEQPKDDEKLVLTYGQNSERDQVQIRLTYPEEVSTVMTSSSKTGAETAENFGELDDPFADNNGHQTERRDVRRTTSGQVGDIIVMGDVALQVTEMFESSGSVNDQPRTGYDYVVIKVILKNQGQETFSYNPFQFSLKNESGETVDKTLIRSDYQMALGTGDIAPGGIASGTVTFEQPLGESSLELLYEVPDADGQIVVALMEEKPRFSELVVDASFAVLGEPHKMREDVLMGDLVFRVNGVKRSQGSEGQKPKIGHEFVIVDVTLTNDSDGPLDYSPLDFMIQDGNGNRHTKALSAVDKVTALKMGVMVPHSSVTGTIAFQVPVDDEILLIYEGSKAYEGGDVLVDLN